MNQIPAKRNITFTLDGMGGVGRPDRADHHDYSGDEFEPETDAERALVKAHTKLVEKFESAEVRYYAYIEDGQPTIEASMEFECPTEGVDAMLDRLRPLIEPFGFTKWEVMDERDGRTRYVVDADVTDLRPTRVGANKWGALAAMEDDDVALEYMVFVY